MAELITLTTPVEAPKTVFRIARIAFDWYNAHIVIVLREWTGTAFGPRELDPIHYTGDVATQLMIQLNKINLSTQSLHQRVMTRLLADGKLPAGTASGVPD